MSQFIECIILLGTPIPVSFSGQDIEWCCKGGKVQNILSIVTYCSQKSSQFGVLCWRRPVGNSLDFLRNCSDALFADDVAKLMDPFLEKYTFR